MQISPEAIMPVLAEAATSFVQAALRIGLILVAGYVATRLLRTGLHHLQAWLARSARSDEPDPNAADKRAATLTGLLRTMGLVVIWALVGLISLQQLGFDTTPIIAGAGILGLAVGFGAQNLVRDVISGFILVLENQVRVGDVAIVNGTGGLVEAVTFRTIVLRDLAGVVHVFPNGGITTLSNMTRGWSAYVIDVGVAYREDTDRVVALMREVAEELQKDPAFGPSMLEPIEVLGVDDFGESQVTIKARLKTRPIHQWNVGREYRRRLKKAFDARGIEIPFPHRSIYVGAESKPVEVVLTDGRGQVR